MSNALTAFHFFRPAWLIAIPVVVLLWLWLHWRRQRSGAFRGVIAEHLLQHLVVGPISSRWITPENSLLSLWFVGAIAAAGPSWRPQPSPFADDKAGMIIVLRVSESMLNPDFPPSRLQRCLVKLRDLLHERGGAPTGLVAYNGSAHLVMPMTTDADVVSHMLQALSPEIMPQEGDALLDALQLATSRLANIEAGGSILLVCDSIDQTQIPLSDSVAFSPVQILVPLASHEAVQAVGVSSFAKASGATPHLLAPDDSDINAIVRGAAVQISGAQMQDATRWDDGGYWLVPLLAMLSLLWCRRGWSVRL